LKKLLGIPFIVLILSIGITPAYSQMFINTTNNDINATVNTASRATLNWQFSNYNSTNCFQQSLNWNEGTGPQRNDAIFLDSDGAATLNIFGWHIFDVVIVAKCGTNSTNFGPFDLIINTTANFTPEPTFQSQSSTELQTTIEGLISLNQKLIDTIHKLIDKL